MRFAMPMFPLAAWELGPVIAILAVIGIIFGALMAYVQSDMKKLVAYSSISHMGFVTLGFFLFSVLGVEGALAQMLSHGFVSAAMFLCIGVMYDRVHSRQIEDYGGVVNTMPKFAAFMMLFAMANAGLPGTSGFVGEFIVILASVKVNFWIGFAAAISLILGAAYTLWMYKRVIFGEVANDNVAKMKDLGSREFWLLAIVALAVLFMGVWPKPFIDVMHASVTDLLTVVGRSKL
jgi:NADH-quinone oxidoreductase subunit M